MGNLSSLSHWIWNRDNINPWVALFKIQARVHDVLERIIPPKDDGKKAAYEKAKATDLPLWNRLDAPVLQWIYATISTDILNSILIDDDLAEHAWESVADLFHDNKHSRALFLSNEFTTTKLADFSTTNAYCNQLKSIVDQLANVGAPVNDHALVFKLLQGLNEPYKDFAMIIQNKKNLPKFTTVRSKLGLAEKNLREQAKQEDGTALCCS
nr:uncharacterized protein LOC110791525 [Spinacia oleracea]